RNSLFTLKMTQSCWIANVDCLHLLQVGLPSCGADGYIAIRADGIDGAVLVGPVREFGGKESSHQSLLVNRNPQRTPFRFRHSTGENPRNFQLLLWNLLVDGRPEIIFRCGAFRDP